jgi:hypothetical protein
LRQRRGRVKAELPFNSCLPREQLPTVNRAKSSEALSLEFLNISCCFNAKRTQYRYTGPPYMGYFSISNQVLFKESSPLAGLPAFS